ncbi:MAG: glycosyltransferase family 1 protein [Anaerolineae bacterium]
MRVAIDYTPALRQGAGIGRYTRGLVAALAEIDRANSYILFSAGERPPADGGGAGWPANFTLRHTPLSARWLTIAWHRLHLPLPAELLTGACDLFHAPDFVLPPLRRARGIVTVHDLSFLRLPECADPGLRAFLEQVVPRSVARATRVLADSESTRRDLMALLGVEGDKIDVVTPGVEPRFRRVENVAQLTVVRARYRLPRRFILGIGTLEPRKNFVGLIRAYAQMRRTTGLEHALVIAGRPGWLYEEIFAEVERQGLTEDVHFPGFVADADLPALYSLADLLAYPSLYEGFGIPVVEAMACGTPVVAGNNSSLPEAAGTAALLVDARDTDGLAKALAQALTDTALRRQMIERGYIQARRFTWQHSATDLLAAYRAAMA